MSVTRSASMTADAAASLSGFAPLTDPIRARSWLAPAVQHLWGAAAKVTDCAVLDVHHRMRLKERSRDKETLGVAYRLSLAGRDASVGRGACPDSLLYVLAFRGGRSSAAFGDHAARQPGDGIVHLADDDAIAWRFPADPALKTLTAFCDSRTLAAHLPHAALGLRSADDIHGLSTDVLNYRPGQRLTARLRIDALAGADRVERPLFAKVFARATEARDRFATLLWANEVLGTRASPRAIGVDDALHALWIEGLEALPGDALAHVRTDPTLLDQAAATLARLHAADRPDLRELLAWEVLDETHKKLAKLARAFPDHANAFARIAASLTLARPGAERYRPAPIHNDFHVRQLVPHRTGLALVDFDEVTLGDPARDLGHFIADLACCGLEASEEQCLAMRLVDAWRRESTQPVTTLRLQWHVLAELVAKCYRGLIQRRLASHDAIAPLVGRLDREADTLLITLHRGERS